MLQNSAPFRTIWENPPPIFTLKFKKKFYTSGMVAGCEGGEDGECGRSGCCNVEQTFRPAIKRIQERLQNMSSETLHAKS